MPRFFNTAGPCLAENHYMIEPGRRLSQVRALIEKCSYFVIHAPRQTGKTTLLRNLSRELTAEGTYSAVTVSLESMVEPDLTSTMSSLVRHIEDKACQQLQARLCPPKTDELSLTPITALNKYLSVWSETSALPVVVFFDEIDSLPGPVLISILRQLRDGYTSRPAAFPHSVVLVGMRDVRDYRVDARDETKSLGTASPFNIKDESLLLRNFTREETLELLEQHTAETGQRFEDDAAEEVFTLSGGQPWLVNALAAQLTTRYDALVPDPGVSVNIEDVCAAKEILIERRDTHLDSLVDKLREERVKKVIEQILIGGISVDPTYDDDFSYTRDLGLVAIEGGVRKIANPIYGEIIPRVLTHQVQTSIPDEPAWFVAKDGTLNIEKLIQGFLKFWSRHGEVLLRGMPYQEAAPHLVFMAYLQRIVNSGGRITREFAIGTGRADLVVEYGGREDVIELKLQRDKHTLPEGLEQVSRYAKRLDRETGYLIIFNPKSKIPWEDRGEVEEMEQDGVKVVVVRA